MRARPMSDLLPRVDVGRKARARRRARAGTLSALCLALFAVVGAIVAPNGAPATTEPAHLLRVAATGGPLRVLAPVPAFALSPDRKQALVAVRTPDGSAALAVRTLASGAERVVFTAPAAHIDFGTDDPARRFGEAVWPSANVIVFNWIDDSTCNPGDAGCVTGRLERITPAGGDPVRLSDSARYPAFSTGGSRWAALSPYEFYDAIGNVTLTTAAGQQVYGWSGLPPALAPAGDEIAWIGSADTSVPPGPTRLRVAGRVRASLPLTFDPQIGPEFGALAWSPDGRTLAFLRGGQQAVPTSRRTSLCLADRTLRRIRCLYTDGEISHPLWSPDGRRIAIRTSSFQKRGNIVTTERLVIVPVARGSRARVVAIGNPPSGTEWGIQPVGWSHDGRQVYFNGDAHASR